MNELELKLTSMVETLDEMTKILNKSLGVPENYFGSVNKAEQLSMVMLYKTIEDGILDKIKDANQHQLNHILNSYRFRYYTEFNTDKELLKNEIQKRLRDNKLKNLGL